MRVADQHRFQIEAAAGTEDAQLWITCDRCDWIAVYDEPVSFADLEERADEHTEVCR